MARPDLQQALAESVIVAQSEDLKVGTERCVPGQDVTDDVRSWKRGFVDVTHSRAVAFSPAALARMVREALKADPSLAREIADAAGLADPRPHDKPRR